MKLAPVHPPGDGIIAGSSADIGAGSNVISPVLDSELTAGLSATAPLLSTRSALSVTRPLATSRATNATSERLDEWIHEPLKLIIVTPPESKDWRAECGCGNTYLVAACRK
jgi:hypothetical protein